MWIPAIALRYTTGFPLVALREPITEDELAIQGADTATALQLLDRLMQPPLGKEASGLPAEQIVTADRDWILAQLYLKLYGPDIKSSITCKFCEQLFDLDFRLPDLCAHIQGAASLEGIEITEAGTYQLPSGACFRLPTGADELALLNHSTEADIFLLKRCLLKGDPQTEAEAVQLAMQQIAPVLQSELAANCPECGKKQMLRFDMQSYLLDRLKNDRKQTIWEAHCLATQYHWSHREIMALPRTERIMFASFIGSPG